MSIRDNILTNVSRLIALVPNEKAEKIASDVDKATQEAAYVEFDFVPSAEDFEFGIELLTYGMLEAPAPCTIFSVPAEVVGVRPGFVEAKTTKTALYILVLSRSETLQAIFLGSRDTDAIDVNRLPAPGVVDISLPVEVLSGLSVPSRWKDPEWEPEKDKDGKVDWTSVMMKEFDQNKFSVLGYETAELCLEKMQRDPRMNRYTLPSARDIFNVRQQTAARAFRYAVACCGSLMSSGKESTLLHTPESLAKINRLRAKNGKPSVNQVTRISLTKEVRRFYQEGDGKYDKRASPCTHRRRAHLKRVKLKDGSYRRVKIDAVIVNPGGVLKESVYRVSR